MTSRGHERRADSTRDWSERSDESEQRAEEAAADEPAGSDGTGDQEAPDEDVERGQSAQERLPLDAVFEILKNERRRIVLEYLAENPGEVKLGDLAEHVAIEENDISPGELTSTERKRAYVGLYQCHLPKMDELGAVEFNRDRGLIELGANVDQLEPYLDGPDDPEPWASYYLALAGANAALFAGVVLVDAAVGAGMTGPGSMAVAALTVASFAGLATVHHRRREDGDEDGPTATDD